MDIHGLLVGEGWSRSGFRWKPMSIPCKAAEYPGSSSLSTNLHGLQVASGYFTWQHRPEKTSIFYAVNMGGKNRQKNMAFLGNFGWSTSGFGGVLIILYHFQTHKNILHHPSPFHSRKTSGFCVKNADNLHPGLTWCCTNDFRRFAPAAVLPPPASTSRYGFGNPHKIHKQSTTNSLVQWKNPKS